jgi:hypothetical protein
MDEDQVQGVTSEETTSGISPNVNQTTQDDADYSAEEQSNTEVSDSDGTVEDKRIPYDRFQEKVSELNEMKIQMAELKAKAEVADRLGQAFNPETSSPENRARQQQLEAARKELEQMGYVDKTTVDQLVEEKLSAYKWQERFVNQMDQLEKKYTGKDGGPKFDKDEIARFMDDQMAKGNQITDPELAFKIMHMDQLAEGKAKAQRSSTYSEKPGGSVHAETDQRKADLAAASKTGNMQSFLKKYINIPD